MCGSTIYYQSYTTPGYSAVNFPGSPQTVPSSACVTDTGYIASSPTPTPSPIPSPKPTPIPSGRYQIYINAPVAGITNLNVASATSSLCPSYLANVLVPAIIGLGLDPNIVLYNANVSNGCAAVSPLPSPTQVVRVDYKYLLVNMNDGQFRQLVTALSNPSIIMVCVVSRFSLMTSPYYAYAATS